LFNFFNKAEMWQELLQNKYLKTKTLAQVEAKPTDSPFGKELFMEKMNSSNGHPLLLVMAKQLDFGRILGLTKLH
jgi:hypothetical protein